MTKKIVINNDQFDLLVDMFHRDYISMFYELSYKEKMADCRYPNFINRTDPACRYLLFEIKGHLFASKSTVLPVRPVRSVCEKVDKIGVFGLFNIQKIGYV